jgi:hypothetical protein
MTRRSAAIEACRRAVAAIDAVLLAEGADDSWRPSPAELREYRSRLAMMLGDLESGNLPPRSERPDIMSHPIVDSWPLESELGQLIVEAEQRYRQL